MVSPGFPSLTKTSLRIKLIIFDLDGTLIDSRGDLADAVNELRRRFNQKNLMEQQVRRHVGQGVTHLLDHTIAASPRRQHPDFLLRQFGRIYGRRCLKRTRLFPGVSTTLPRLAGLRLAVASNKPGILSRRILRGLNVRHMFSAVLGGDDVRRRKPHPEPIRRLMRRFRAKPKETLVVGDSRFDMEAGARARCRLCACTFGFGSRAELARWRPDFTIARFAELLGVVQQLRRGCQR